MALAFLSSFLFLPLLSSTSLGSSALASPPTPSTHAVSLPTTYTSSHRLLEEPWLPRPCPNLTFFASQILTGICSSCLMERLTSVRNPAEAKIVEVGTADASEGSSADSSKLRKTLMLLFQLDDSGGAGTTHLPEAKDPQVAEFEVHPGGGGIGNRGAKWKGGSWLRSILPKRGMRWKRKEPSRPPGEGLVDPGDGGGDAQVEQKPSFRRSSEWLVYREPSRGSLEVPRHSWDGSMVGRAFACLFACLEEPPDGARRARRSNAEEAVVESLAEVAESRDREFVRKGEHVLELSLSESRKETRRGKNGETADIDVEIQPGRNGHGSGRASLGAVRSSQAAANGDAQNF